MSWIITYSGTKFDVIRPRVEDVRLDDIAHHLSMICRFTGAVERFYSVAEHSIYVSQMVQPQHALAGLFHDASEAYVCDIARPIKHDPAMARYRDIEDALQPVICERFGVPYPFPDEMHEVDLRMAATEAVQLFQSPPEWAVNGNPFEIPIIGYSPRVAEHLWLQRYYELIGDQLRRKGWAA